MPQHTNGTPKKTASSSDDSKESSNHQGYEVSVGVEGEDDLFNGETPQKYGIRSSLDSKKLTRIAEEQQSPDPQSPGSPS